ARQLGASSNRVMKALIKAGIYKPLAPKVKLSKRQLWAVKRHEVARKHHVGIAQRLAKLNGGMIPTTVWLRANCHLDTLEYMRRYPDFFAHLSRARFCKAKNPLFDAEKAVALYCANVSVPDIAVSFGYSRQTGNNRIINALKRAGVYRAKEKPGHGSPAGADCGADSANVSGRIIQPNNLAVLDQNEKQGEADFGSAG
ncbi:MAG TPA: hypothetical protein VFB79_15915, partial [Candidatus Angelobacter sp.]|nr:hypothetical protein [Candidatus Angelobacter sp.]